MEAPARSPLIEPPDDCRRALDTFRARNESFRDCVVLHLSNRGLCAELSDVARAAIYAWKHDLQLLLDSTRFAYRVERGWGDYFEAFCHSADEVDPARIRERFEFGPQGPDRKPVRRLQVYRTDELQLGELRLTGFSKILEFFQKFLFRLNPRCRRLVAQHIAPLPLPASYYALHIRRGDKIGDEDVHYPALLYLRELGAIPERACIFVMSDEHAAVEEVRRAVQLQGLSHQILSMATAEDTGFDVELLRRGQSFMSRDGSRRRTTDRQYKEIATIRLLADMVVATGATKIVSSNRSFVGTTLKALAPISAQVRLLEARDASNFIATKLSPGRHILDAYEKVLMIRIGHTGAGFFAYVQYALNQIQFAERNHYLPVVHFNRDFENHFYDADVGEDVWSYYFEAVAGYSKADIDAMLADREDPLGAQDIVQLSNEKIMRLCQLDPRSIFHYTYGYWRNHLPDDPESWYGEMRRKGHRYVSEYVKVRPEILAEVEDFHGRHMKGHRVLGAHIRGTDMRYAPQVPLDRFQREIDEMFKRGFQRVLVATDQQQYIATLEKEYGDRLIYQDCLRSTDARNPMWLQQRSPAQQGKEVLIDALLLSRCEFLLKSPSAVSEFAHYFRPTLESRDLNDHRTEYGGQDYAKPGLGYGDYPNAWDVVGEDVAQVDGPERLAPWIDPSVRRVTGE